MLLIQWLKLESRWKEKCLSSQCSAKSLVTRDLHLFVQVELVAASLWLGMFVRYGMSTDEQMMDLDFFLAVHISVSCLSHFLSNARRSLVISVSGFWLCRKTRGKEQSLHFSQAFCIKAGFRSNMANTQLVAISMAFPESWSWTFHDGLHSPQVLCFHLITQRSHHGRPAPFLSATDISSKCEDPLIKLLALAVLD